MADSERKTESPADELPSGDASFFAVVRALQVRHRALLGHDSRPKNEPVRLRARPTLAYPAAELANAFIEPGGRVNLEVDFLGLFGPSGALPNVYTQLIIDRMRGKDHALREFLDLFNHRWLSLFYRAWEKHDFSSAFQTAAGLDREDAVTRLLWSLVGFGTKGQRGRLRLAESSLLHFSGLLSNARPRQSALAQIAGFWFGIGLEVRQLQGQWLSIPRQDQSRMESVTLGGSSSNRLGVDAVAGSRIWNVENRFRLRIGPLSGEQFSNFSPGGERIYELCALVRTYVGPQFDFDVQVLLRREDVPGTCLKGGTEGSRLGWDTWLGNWPFNRDADDPVFEFDDKLSLTENADRLY